MIELGNPNGDMFYTVGDKKFYNLLLAMQEAEDTKQEIKFRFFEDIMDSWDWTEDPTLTHSWEKILADRAWEIRLSHKKVRIWFSGGRDSWIVLKAFIENGIFIDEIAVVNHSYSKAEFYYIWEWLKKNKHLFHKNTVIRELAYTHKTFYKRLKKAWALDPNLAHITPIMNFYEAQKHVLDKHEPDGVTAEVSGVEKPKLRIVDKNFHFRLTDVDVKVWLGARDHVPFFISRNVPIFQYTVHHMKNYILNYLRKNKIVDLHTFNNSFGVTANYYTFKNGEWVASSENDPDSIKLISPLYEDFCRAGLRDQYAHPYLGHPHIKLQSCLAGSKRIGTRQWAEIEKTMRDHFPDQFKHLKEGVQMGDWGFHHYFGNEHHENQAKPIYSKTYKIPLRPAKRSPKIIDTGSKNQ